MTPDDGFWNTPALMNMAADFLMGLSIIALAWAAVTALQRLPVFPLRELVVTGSLGQVTRAQIEHTARIAVTGNFFTTDMESIRAAFENLPWVRKVEVRRRWPDSIELTLEEQVAVARWKPANSSDSQNGRLVNDHGEVFAGTASEALPAFFGPEGSSMQLLERYRDFAVALTGHKVEMVILSTRDAWQLKLDNGLLLELGRDQRKHPLTERIDRFARHYSFVRASTGLVDGGVADMRYPNGFTLRPGSKS